MSKTARSGKQLRKKKYKQKKKQIKKFERMGLSPQEIEKKMEEIEKNEKNKNFEKLIPDETEIDEYDIDDLIERPRVSSVPKVNLNFAEKDNNNEDMLDEEEIFNNNNNFNNGLDEAQQAYDINLMEYARNLQSYAKEKNRIIHDDKYRKNIIIQNEMLSKAKNDVEKAKIIKELKKI